MRKNRLFKNTTKISEMKDITGILCIILAVTTAIGGVASFNDYRQNAALTKLEQQSKPLDEQVQQYRTEVKRYFSNYVASDAVKKDIIKETNISESLFDALDASGIAATLTDEQIDSLVTKALENLDYESILESAASQEYRTLYNSLYRTVQEQVIKNVKEQNMMVVTQTVTYDTNQIKNSVLSKLDAYSTTTTNKNKQIDQAALDAAWTETITENILDKLEVPDSKKKEIVDHAVDEVAKYLNSAEGLALVSDGKDGKDGHIGKDGKEVKKGIDYYTPQEITDTTNKISDLLYPILQDYIEKTETENPGSIKLNALNGYSIIDMQIKADPFASNAKTTAYTLTTSWARGKSGDIQEAADTVVLLEDVTSIAGIEYSENYIKNWETDDNLEDDLNFSQGAVLQVSYYITDKNGNIKVFGVKDTIPVDSLANAYSKVYLQDLYDTLYNKPFKIPNTSAGTIKYCVEQDANGNDISKYYCIEHDRELLFNSNSQWICSYDGHGITDTTSVDLKNLQNKVNDITDAIGGLFDGASQWTDHNVQTSTTHGAGNLSIPNENFPDAPTESTTTHVTNTTNDVMERAKKEMLARYDLVLQYMNKDFTSKDPLTNEEITQSIFDVYQNTMQDVEYQNTMQDVDRGKFGIESIHGIDVTEKGWYLQPNINVLKQFLIEAEYITESNNTLAFAGSTLDEQLLNAADSHIIDYLQLLITNMYGDTTDSAVAAQIETVIEIFSNYLGAYEILTKGVITVDINETTPKTLKNGCYVFDVEISDKESLQGLYNLNANGNYDYKPRHLTIAKNLESPNDDSLDYNLIKGAILSFNTSSDQIDLATVEIYADPLLVDYLKNFSFNLTLQY